MPIPIPTCSELPRRVGKTSSHRGERQIVSTCSDKRVCTCSGKCSQGASMLLQRLPTSLPNCFRRARSARRNCVVQRATRCLPEPIPLKGGVETAAQRKAPRSIKLNATVRRDAHSPEPAPMSAFGGDATWLPSESC